MTFPSSAKVVIRIIRIEDRCPWPMRKIYLDNHTVSLYISVNMTSDTGTLPMTPQPLHSWASCGLETGCSMRLRL